MYRDDNEKGMSTPALAQLLSTTLYYKRFFPYYCFNLMASLNEQGQGICYSYDAIGSSEERRYGVQGSGAELAVPLLDNLYNPQHMHKEVADKLNMGEKRITLERAIETIKSIFIGISERDIYTGDEVEIIIMTKTGMKTERMALRKD